MINGAQIMVKCLEEEAVSVVFGYPGAAICPFYDELYSSSIRHILVRQEQNAAHAASGYARCSGKPGVCIATSGPGATNLITGLATAYMDSIPLVAITGQVKSDLLGRDVFQEADITGACEPFIKHSYLVSRTADLPRIFKEAFHIARSGRPGPVLIDIPIDIQQQEIDGFHYPDKADIIGYKPRTQGHPLQIKKAVNAICSAKRPVIFAGGGTLSGGAKRDLVALAERTGIPVVSTMMGIGVMPTDHELYLGMMGSHGLKAANRAIHQADLLILCGARVGDRAVASPDQITEKASVIHIDVDPAEIGKNMRADIPIVGDIKLVLSSLNEKIQDYHVPEEWAAQVQQWKESLRVAPPVFEGFVEPRSFIRSLSYLLKSKAILVADVGQNQIWSANNFKIKEGRFLTSGGMGTMGYSIPAAAGAKLARPTREVVAICGDGSFQMSMCELGTIAQNQIGVKIIVMRNVRLGMVRELQDNLYGKRHSATVLDDGFDLLKIAEAYGIPAERVNSNEKAEAAAARMLQVNGPTLLVCDVSPDTPSR